MVHTFLCLDVQPGRSQSFEDEADVDFIFLQRVGVDQEVIEVGGEELVEEIAERIVHEVLEGAWGIAEAERHNLVLEEAVATAKSRFPFFPLSHPEEIIAVPHVQFCEVLSAR